MKRSNESPTSDEERPTKVAASQQATQAQDADDDDLSIGDEGLNIDELDDLDPDAGLSGVGSGGKLKSIKVENFMCHKKYNFALGPKINFVTGQNGSGKSALIVALQICLGMNARQTQRGTNLAGLIRNGATTPAVVRVEIDNTGELAFLPTLYGDSITVERVIRLNGTSKFNFRSAKGEVISQRRETLDDIVNNFNLHVDNPCCVLDQESSKQFLMGDSAAKYEFFLKASMLSNIKDHYRRENDTRTDAGNKMSHAEGALGTLANDVKVAESKVNELEQMGRYQRKLDEVEKQLMWRAYHDQVAVVEKKQEQVDRLQAKVEDAEKRLEKENQDKENYAKQIKAVSDERVEVTAELTVATAACADRQMELEEKQVPLMNAEAELKENNDALKQYQKQLRQAQKEKQAYLKKKMALESAEDQRGQILLEIEEQKKHVESLQADVEKRSKQFESAIQKNRREALQRKEKLNNIKKQIKTVRNRLHEKEDELGEIHAKSKDANARFGSRIPNLLKALERARSRFTHMPLHIGLNTNLTNTAFWRPAENYLKISLNSFLVHCSEDMVELKKMARQQNVPNFRVIISPFLGHRHSINRPRDKSLVTLESILDVADDNVYNVLVDNCHVEAVALFDSAEQASEAMFVSRGSVCVSPEGIKTGLDREGTEYKVMQGSEYVQKANNGSHAPQYFAGSDFTSQADEVKAECERLRNELSIHEQNQNRTEKEVREADVTYNSMQQETTALTQQCHDELVKLETLEQTQAELLEEANDIQVLRHDEVISRLLAAEAKCSGKVDVCEAQCRELEAVLPAYQEKLRDAEAFLQGLEAKDTKLDLRLNELSEEYQTCLHAEKISQERLSKKMEQLQACTLELHEEEAKAQETREGALEFCNNEELNPRKSYKQLNLEAEKLAARIETEKKRLNHQSEDTSEQLLLVAKKDLERAIQKEKKVKVQLEIVAKRLQALKDSSTKRRKLWKDYKRIMQRRCEDHFQYYLSKRKHGGALEFDDKTKQMVIKWSKVADDSQSSKDMITDTKSLSGGERSYTTVALLLAMGKVVETPFRVMDEFDVFMDEAIRKAAITNLIEAAKDDSKQYIFVTPHNVGDAARDGVKVMRLKPPTSNQTVLPFQSA